EVVTPLRHTVRLVDREEGDRRTVEQAQRALELEPLGREVEQVEFAREQLLLDQPARIRTLGGAEERGAHTERLERIDLVLHEGDEGGDDDARAGSHERGDLI